MLQEKQNGDSSVLGNEKAAKLLGGIICYKAKDRTCFSSKYPTASIRLPMSIGKSSAKEHPFGQPPYRSSKSLEAAADPSLCWITGSSADSDQ